MGNSYSIYRFSYHVFSDSIILPINHQKNIMQQYTWMLANSDVKFIPLHQISLFNE